MGVPVPIIDAMRCECGEWVSVPHLGCIEYRMVGDDPTRLEVAE